MRSLAEKEAPEIARRIADEIVSLKARAEKEGFVMLAFLLDMAHVEARLSEFGFAQESPFITKHIDETAHG
jgi:hypothetical protein